MSKSKTQPVHSWLSNSIAAQIGVGWNAEGASHDLTEEKQGTYHYTIGPYSSPVLTVRPGDWISVETRDAFEGVIKSEDDKPSALLKMPYLNPQNGPIMIDGAEKGDAIAIYIESMMPRGEGA